MNLLMNKKSYINPETSIETRFKIECHLCEESKPNTNTITTALLTGPLSSGKTTFLQYISKDIISDGASGAPRTYKVKDAVFDEVTDFSGAEAWLKAKFDEYIKVHDYILFFFDISMYLNDTKYRADVNARVDMIYRTSKLLEKKHVNLLVGTHIDKACQNFKSEFECFFAGKSYQSMLNNIVYINTTKKECVETIFNKLKE